MLILGISDSHEAHACVVKDGRLLSAMAEERLSRLKSDVGYPRLAIDAALRLAGVSADEIDIVAFAGQSGSAFQRIYRRNALFSVQDWVRQNHVFWRPLLLEGKKLSAFEDYEAFKHLRGDDLEKDPYYPFVERAREADPRDYSRIFNEVRCEVVIRHLGVPRHKIAFYRHEDCHKAYGFYSSPGSRDRALVFTIEGGGDDLSATISTMDSRLTFVEHWRSNGVQVGRLYRNVTLLLGMKPGQHEYKVMGLAPYGTEYHGKRSRDFFHTINQVVGTEIHDPRNVRDLYFSVRDALEGERFDGIAWGLQTWLEELLCAWIDNNAREHGIDNIVLSGGVAQNIKANKRLMELDSVSRFWAGPIAGDGSLGIGAAWLAARERDPESRIEGLPGIYLGTEYQMADVDAAVRRHSLQDKFRLIERPTSRDVCDWLTSGLVVARFSGRMEFGQRALGNRSILADPRNLKSVERINSKIKYRDFWMPFTPSMTAGEAERMLVNPKAVYSPYMTMAFDLKPSFVEQIPAAIHPADKTVRPQMLRQEDNPGYYAILEGMKAQTGLGVVLNTSFNLHGEPICESPDDAIRTFLRSDLDVLLFDDIAIARS